MRENFTVIFCVFAVFALIVGKSAVPPNLVTAYSAYQSALDRGDMRRAARYGELTLAAAQKSSLLDAAGRARLATMVAAVEAKSGNPERARALYEQALPGLSDGSHAGEIAAAQAALKALERVTADRTLRGPVTVARGAGG
ncbi:MAG: hypothetical protein WAW96_13935 [Alphaproteobacteria bacterium]